MLVPCSMIVEEGAISTIAIALHHIVSRSVTLPFSPAAGQFNLPVSGQLMTPHTEPRNHLQPMDGVNYGLSPPIPCTCYAVCTYRTIGFALRATPALAVGSLSGRCGTGTQ